MGDYYEFDIRMIDGKEVSGFCYQSEATGWNEIFVQFTDEQAEQANKHEVKVQALNLLRELLIKSWIK